MQSLELLNFQTGEHHLLTQRPIADFAAPHAIHADGLIRTEWEDLDMIGLDGYSLDGKLIYHLIFPLGKRIEWLSVSPDGQVVALIFAREGSAINFPLVLMASDSSWSVTVSKDVLLCCDNFTPVLWSPKSNMMTYWQPTRDNAHLALHIVSPYGDPISTIDVSDNIGAMEWTDCR
jgi:hypothetical protein